MSPARVAIATIVAGTAIVALIRVADPHLTVARGAAQLARMALAGYGSVALRDDVEHARRIASTYYIGDVPGERVPFVYEHRDEPHLVALRERYRLHEIVAGDGGEYAAMMRLATWIGTRFEHGTDEPPGGHNVCDPVAVIEAGRADRRFWCEIAARTMIHAAASLGWPARVITASSSGYRWDHAVAELWSDEFDKWFVVDPDFNVVFESDGVPLSAWELVHEAPRLEREGRLVTRAFGPLKAGLSRDGLLGLFRYAHVDLRTDWCSRRLERGSPAGGDRSTWWTARPGAEPLLSASVQVVRREAFEWPVNHVTIAGEPTGGAGLLRLAAYSPVFSHFEYRFDDGEWRRAEAGPSIAIEPGARRIDARVVTVRGDRGPTTRRAVDAWQAGSATPGPDRPAQRAAGAASS